MATQRIPLFGSLTNRSANGSFSGLTDQIFQNCFPEVSRNPISMNGEAWITKRTALIGADCAPASYVAQGSSLVWTGFSSGPKGLFTYINGTTLAVYDTNCVLVGGTVAGVQILSPSALAETSISNVSNLTLVATLTADALPHAWFMAEGAGAWTAIVDVDYPSNQAAPLKTVGNFAHLDGYAFIMDSGGKIWNSDLNSLANWTATSFIAAQEYPDGGLGVFRTGEIIAAFGNRSIEFFRNAGNATGSPLTRIAGSTISISAVGQGIVGTDKLTKILEVGDSIYFIASVVGTGNFGFYKLTGTRLEKVSTPFIDKVIGGAMAVASADLGLIGGMTFNGQQHVLINSGAYFAYAVDTKMWWKFQTGLINAYTCLGINGFTYMTGYNVAANARKLYTSSITLYAESSDGGGTSSAIVMLIQTTNLDQGTQKKKSFSACEIVCDTQATSGNISISWSDDDFATFSTARSIDPSTGTRRITRLGSTKRNNNNKRAWRIDEQVIRAFRAAELILDYEVGTS